MQIHHSIPVIDYAQAPDRLVAEVGNACRKFGFFGLVNHGIDQALIDAAFYQSKKFFALPQEQKLNWHIEKSACHRGFDPIGWQSLDLSKEGDASAADLKESFYLGTEPQTNAPKPVANHGPNQWPDLPSLQKFEEDMRRYSDAMKSLAQALVQTIGQSLGLDQHALDPMMSYPTCTTRLLYYPPQPSHSDQQIGSGAHTDWGGITVLAQDDAGGLEVKLIDEQGNAHWALVTPQPGMLVINTGDLMQRWSNDIIRSSWHRVINRHSGRSRYSIAFFFDLDHHAQIETLATCISAENPAKYPAISAGDHILDMYRRTTLKS